MKSRDDALQQIADNVRELTTTVETVVTFDRQPGIGLDGIHRRIREHITHRVEHRGLLLQLTDALLPGAASTDQPTSGSKPGSRQPSAAAASAALDAITLGWETGDGAVHEGVLMLQGRMRRAARRGGPPRRPLSAALEDVRSLAHVLPEPWPQDAAEATLAYVQRARQVLTLNAPVFRPRDLRCPYCASQLDVQLDDASVRCPNHACRDAEGHRHRWAREEVAFLLEQLASGEGAA